MSESFIENGITNLVTNFIGMSARNRFRGKEVAHGEGNRDSQNRVQKFEGGKQEKISSTSYDSASTIVKQSLFFSSMITEGGGYCLSSFP